MNLSTVASKAVTDIRALVLAFQNSSETVLKFDRPLSKKNQDILIKTVEELKYFAIERRQKGAVLFDVYKEEPKEEPQAPIPAPAIAPSSSNINNNKDKNTNDKKAEAKASSTGAALGTNPSKNQPNDQLSQIRSAKAKEFEQQKQNPTKKQTPPQSKPLAKPSAVAEKEKKFAEMDDDEALEAALAEVYALLFLWEFFFRPSIMNRSKKSTR